MKLRNALLAMALLGAALTPGRAVAAPLGVTAGYDYYTGPEGQITHGVTAGARLGALGPSLALTLGRYEDNHIGPGNRVNAAGSLGLPLAPVSLRAAASRYWGQQGFHGWRFAAGPRVSVPLVGLAGELSYVHYEDNTDQTSNGLLAQVQLPLGVGISGRVTGSYANWSDGTQSRQLAAGLGLGLLGRLSAVGEVGLARNGFGSADRPLPAHATLGQATSHDGHVSGTASVSALIAFP